jgi:hypothetical protein
VRDGGGADMAAGNLGLGGQPPDGAGKKKKGKLFCVSEATSEKQGETSQQTKPLLR